MDLSDIDQPILCHDDTITIRAQKHKAGLHSQWWRHTIKGDQIGWYNPDEQRSLPMSETHPGAGWLPSWERGVQLADGVYLRAQGSYIEATIGSLWDDLRSRYRLGLEAVVSATDHGIIEYQGAKRTERNRQEALRHRVRDYWVVSSYEHNLILRADMAEGLLEELEEYNQAKDQGFQTVYLKGYQRPTGKNKPILVKVYPMEIHGSNAVKVEVTLRDDYLKRHDLRGVRTWLTQPDIQRQLESALMREWEGIMDRAPATAERLRIQTGAKSNRGAVKKMSGIAYTLTDLQRRMRIQEQKSIDLERRMAKLEERDR